MDMPTQEQMDQAISEISEEDKAKQKEIQEAEDKRIAEVKANQERQEKIVNALLEELNDEGFTFRECVMIVDMAKRKLIDTGTGFLNTKKLSDLV